MDGHSSWTQVICARAAFADVGCSQRVGSSYGDVLELVKLELIESSRDERVPK